MTHLWYSSSPGGWLFLSFPFASEEAVAENSLGREY